MHTVEAVMKKMQNELSLEFFNCIQRIRLWSQVGLKPF